MYKNIIPSPSTAYKHHLHSSTSSRGYLNDSRASSDGVVSDGLVATGQDNIGLTGDTLRHHNAEATVDSGSRDEDRAGNGDESTVQLAHAVDGLENVAGGVEGDGGASRDGTGGTERQRRESLNGQSRVGGRARDNEGSRKGVDLVEVERGVEWRCEWRFRESSTDVGRVAGLNGQD